MAVTVVKNAKQFVGLSSDVKPSLALGQAPTDLPPGSTFYETDTGITSTWNGQAWAVPVTPAVPNQTRFDAMIALLNGIHKELKLHNNFFWQVNNIPGDVENERTNTDLDAADYLALITR